MQLHNICVGKLTTDIMCLLVITTKIRYYHNYCLIYMLFINRLYSLLFIQVLSLNRDNHIIS